MLAKKIYRKLLSEMHGRNSKYIKNNKFNKDCTLAIFASKCLRKFSRESFFAKIAKKNWLANLCDCVKSWTYLLGW